MTTIDLCFTDTSHIGEHASTSPILNCVSFETCADSPYACCAPGGARKGRVMKHGIQVHFSTITAHALLLNFLTAQAGLVKLAESGDVQPNGTNQYFQISQMPTLNERGQVTFYTDLRYDGFLKGRGMFLADGETVKTIVLSGEAPPDSNGNFSTFHDPATLNSSNQVVWVDLTGTLGGSSDDAGIYQVSGGVLTQLAREGQPATPESGTFKDLASASVPVNRNGQAAFVGSTSSNIMALFRSTGTNLARLAYYNERSPDGNGTLGNLFYAPAINNHGQVAFFSTVLSSTNSSGIALLLADGSSLKVLTRTQKPSPDGNGVFLIFPNALAAVNDRGQAAFVAMLVGTAGGSADNQGLYRTDGDTTVQLVRKGQFVPNGNGRFLDFGQGYVAINNDGQVAFFANLTGTSGGSSDNAGIFLVTGTNITQLARKGQAAPDSNGVYSTFGLGHPALNNHGQVAFNATLSGTAGGSTDNQGVYLVNADGSIQQIIRAGWVIDGETVGIPGFLDGPNYGGTSGFNDEGQIAVWTALNGNEAVLLWSRPEMTGTAVSNNVVTVGWKNYGGATNVVQASSSITGTFTNIATIPVRANRLVRTNFSEPVAAGTTARFYKVSETK